MSEIAIILIRGLAGIKSDIKDTLFMLGLRKKHACVIRPATKDTLGMVKKAKDYITWGEIDAETHKLLIEKRGRKDTDGNIKKHFHLHPPQGGFERQGIKRSYPEGGVLGNRKSEINALVKKML